MMYCTCDGAVENVGGHSLASSDADASARSRTHINQPAAVTQRACDGVDHDRDLRQRLLHCGGDLARILMVDDARDLQRILRVQPMRGGVRSVSVDSSDRLFGLAAPGVLEGGMYAR